MQLVDDYNISLKETTLLIGERTHPEHTEWGTQLHCHQIEKEGTIVKSFWRGIKLK